MCCFAAAFNNVICACHKTVEELTAEAGTGLHGMVMRLHQCFQIHVWIPTIFSGRWRCGQLCCISVRCDRNQKKFLTYYEEIVTSSLKPHAGETRLMMDVLDLNTLAWRIWKGKRSRWRPRTSPAMKNVSFGFSALEFKNEPTWRW